MTNHEFQKIRWEKILSILSQASQNSFSPTMRIRAHFRETMAVHGFTDKKAVDEVTRQYLREVSARARPRSQTHTRTSLAAG